MQALISPLSIAPMIDWTYTHFRVLMRLIAPQALLYTEMQTIGAVKNNLQKALYFEPCEHPIALQLGGASPQELAECAKLAEQLGYAEVNLNLGCPSDRVQAGRFGACLMSEAALVADCIKAMKQEVSIPITAKTRIGIDNLDSYEFFSDFVHQLVEAGCDKIVVHARKAWLTGLNPKQNRTIPPLHYDYVYRLKKSYPDLPIVLNGQINDLEQVQENMQDLDGVMIGRLACNNPYLLGQIHQYFYPEIALQSRYQILQAYLEYCQSHLELNGSWSFLLKPLLNFAHGLPKAKAWKSLLLQVQQTKDTHLLSQSLIFMQDFAA